MADYAPAPKGVGYTGMVTGIIGTAGAVANAMTEMARGRNGGQARDPAEKPITRYDMELIRENIELKSHQYTDARIGEVKEVQAKQMEHNAAVNITLQSIQGQVLQLYGLTRLTIPNSNINPGWGPVTVTPGFPAPVQPPTVSSGGSANTSAAVSGA